MLEDRHDVRDRKDLVTGVVDIHGVVGTVQILALRNGQRQRLGVVDGEFHLSDVPVGAEQGRIDDADVRTDGFDLLGIPERESIVVAVGDQHAVGTDGFEVVAGHLDGGAAVAAVVVVPVFGRHQGRDEEADGGHAPGYGHGALPSDMLDDGFEQRRYGEADPHGEHVEGAGIGVVAFTDLVRRLVEVHHDGDARHEEHQEGQPAAALVAVVLEEQADQTQQQRKEVIVVLAAVRGQDGRRLGLVAQPELVQEPDAGLPVSVEDLSGRGAVDVVLAADEIPHEIPPVHPVELVVEEEPQVGSEGGFLVVSPRDVDSLSVHVTLVESLVAAVGTARPHTREQHFAGGQVTAFERTVRVDILAVQKRPVFGLEDLIGRVEVLAVHQRRTAVLLAVEVPDEGEGIVRLVLVGRRQDAGTDDHDAEDRESDHDGRQAEQDRVPQDLAFVQGLEQAPEAQRQDRHQEEGGTAVDRQMKGIDEEQVEVGGQFRKIRDQEEEEEADDDGGQQENAGELPERIFPVFFLPVIIKENDGRDGQEVQQVHADGKTHQEGDQDDPAVGMRPVRLLVPLGHGPEDHGGEEGRHGIDLAFDGGEPEGVGETVGKGADRTAAEDGDGFRNAPDPVLAGFQQALGEKDDGQVEEEDRQGGANRTHGIDGHGGVSGVREHGEEPGDQLEDRVSWRVADFQFIGRCDEFAAIPEGCRRLDGGQVGDGGDDENRQRHDPVPLVELLLFHIIVSVF